MSPADSVSRPTVQTLKLDRAPAIDGPAQNTTGFEILFDATPTPILVLDRETLRFVRVNDAALAFYGYSLEEFLALRLPDIRPEKIPGEIEGMIARFDDPTLPDTPRLHLTKAGEWRIVKVNARIFDFDGRPAILAAVFDMTREQELQRDLRAAKTFLRNMVDGVPMAMFAKDAASGRYISYNSAAEQLFGIARADMIGNVAADVFGAEEARKFTEQDCQVQDAGPAGITSEVVICHPQRGERCIRMKKVVVSDGEADGRRYILAVAEDVTEERLREAQIAHYASHDGLTGLANRWLFQQKLAEARQAAGASGARGIAVHYIDLDGFKAVNDSWGHRVGDGVLAEAARRMQSILREGDVVARFGGDEFAVLQVGISSIRLVKVLAERLVATLSEPYHVDGHVCDIGASIGICRPRPSMTLDGVIEEADRALYTAKRQGKGRFVLSAADDRNEGGRPHDEAFG